MLFSVNFNVQGLYFKKKLSEAAVIVGSLVFLGLALIKIGGIFFVIDRPVINLSYFLAFLFFRGIWCFIICVMLVFFDIVFSISFSGLSGVAVLGLVKFIPYSGMYGVSLFALFIILLFMFSFGLYRVFSRVSKQSVFISLCFIVFLSSISKFAFSYSISTVGLPGLIVKHQLGLLNDDFQYKRLFTFKTTFQKTDSASFLASNINDKDDKIISIVVESLGYPNDGKLLMHFQNKISSGTGDRSSSIHMTKFQGSTINGEIRELCSAYTDGLVIAKIPHELNCIPEQLSARGYSTLAFHNNTGRFYDRVLWYPQVGLKTFYDVDYLSKLAYAKKSRVFDAVDDRTVVTAITSILKKENRYFVHWLTIDSHGPYSSISDSLISRSAFNCGEYSISTKIECNYLKQLDIVLDDVIHLANEIPDAKVIVSGDHAPRFYEVASIKDIELAKDDYRDDVVSSFVIYPKNSNKD